MANPQHTQTPKEQCFQSAMDELKKVRDQQGKTTPKIDYQRPWTQNDSEGPLKGQWRPEPEESTWGKIMGSIAKTARLIDEYLDPSKDPATGNDRWPTGQPRFPDTTVTGADGKSVPIEQKYDRDSGGRDQWGTQNGQQSGKNQLEDYNEMTKQQTGRENQALALDPDSCECKKRKEEGRDRVRAPDPAKAPASMFVAPSANAPLEALPEFPSLGGLPVFGPLFAP
jgi:hypothetical protein